MPNLFKGEKTFTRESLGGATPPPGVYRRGPDGTLTRCSGEFIQQAIKEDEEKARRKKEEALEREKKKKEKEIAAYSHPDIQPKMNPCKCGRFRAEFQTKDVVDVWNKHLRDARRLHETNIRIVLFAPLLYNRSTLEPKWQQWMRKLDLIIDDSAPLERKKEVFFRLDELDKVLEYMHTKLSTMKIDDYNSMTWLLEDVEKVLELQVAMEIAKTNSYFTSFYETLKTKKKMKDSSVGRLMALVTIKQYWQYVHQTVVHKKELLAALMRLSEKEEREMNMLKDRGNTLFKNSKFRSAHDMYTKALKKGVFNYILYSNRCQTSLRMEDFWDALWDARRAVTIKPEFEKGYYRYAQAFYELKDIDRALRENKRGQKLCVDIGGKKPDNLINQATMLMNEKQRMMSLISKKSEVPDLVSESDTDSDSDADQSTSRKKPNKPSDIKRDLQKSKQDWEKKEKEKEKKKKEEEARKERELEEKRRKERERQELLRAKQEQDMMDQMILRKIAEEDALREQRDQKRAKKAAEKAERKRKEEERKAQERKQKEEKEKMLKEKERQAKKEAEKARLQKEEMKRENERLAKERSDIEKCLADGSLALVSGQSRQAITQYDKAAELMKATHKKCGGMREADYIVFLYAQATAYLKSGIPSEINEALSRFESITKDYPSMRNGLPFYGLATSLFKLNRFKEALDPIEKSLFITTHFEQTIHTWPGTSTSIEETEKGKLEAALKELQRWCRNPPSPDALCRYTDCTLKREMYLSDLDFKGYIKVQCSERCYIDYHITCWKAIKNERNITGEREALHTPCSTPDCQGTLSTIKVIGANGLLKTEAKVEKPPKPHKEEKKKPPQKPNKDQKKGKKYRKHHQSESSKTEKSQGDAEGQAGHGQTTEGAHAALGAVKPRSGSDAGTTVSTEDAKSDASGSLKIEGAEAYPDAPQPEATYVLKRDDFEDVDQKKMSKVKSKKNRKPAAMQLDEEATNIVQINFEPEPNRLRFGADDAEQLGQFNNRGWNSTLTVSEDQPFAVPPHLQDAARAMDASFQAHKPVVIPETDEEKSQKMVLFLHFTEILSSNGPMHYQDPIITLSMEHLTFEHQELIAKRGGLRPFLRESDDMYVIGEYVSMKSDAKKCKDIAVLNGYEETPPLTVSDHFLLNPNSRPFIPQTLTPFVMEGAEGATFNPTLSVGLDRYGGAIRGPVSALDSFDGDESGEEDDEEDDDEEEEISKTGETKETSYESDDDDETLTTSSDDEDDDDEDTDDDHDESNEAFHDASSDLHPSKFDGLDSALYEPMVVGHITESKLDGIDDDDYHWEDHYSSKELTVDEVDDDVDDAHEDSKGSKAHEDNNSDSGQLFVGGGGSSEMNNEPIGSNDDGLIASTDIIHEEQDVAMSAHIGVQPSDLSEGEPSGIVVINGSSNQLESSINVSSLPSEHDDGIPSDEPKSSEISDTLGDSVIISEKTDEDMNPQSNVDNEISIGAEDMHTEPLTEQLTLESNEIISEYEERHVNQTIDEGNSDDGTPVDLVFNNPTNDDPSNGIETSEIAKPLVSPLPDMTQIDDDSKLNVNGPESHEINEELPRTVEESPLTVQEPLQTVNDSPAIAERDYEKMFEKRFQQWKLQRPPSPVHEQRTLGTNTDRLELEDEMFLKRKIDILKEELEQSKLEKKQAAERLLKYRAEVDIVVNERITSIQKKYQDNRGLFDKLEQDYRVQASKLNDLEEIHKSCKATYKNYTQLKERFDKLVLSSAEETESLKTEISILRNSVKDKEKINKVLEKQSKKLMTDKQELLDTVASLRTEMTVMNEDRLTAEARRSQMETAMEESKKIPKELKEANRALEVQLKEKEEVVTKTLERACKAESQFLQLFMAKELKPLDEACKEAEYHIKTIANIIQNNPTMEEHVRAIRSMWQDCLATNQRAAAKAQTEFQSQMQSIQSGATDLDSMKPVEVPAPYKPEGLAKQNGGQIGSQAAVSPNSSMTQGGLSQGGLTPSGSWLMSQRQGGAGGEGAVGGMSFISSEEIQQQRMSSAAVEGLPRKGSGDNLLVSQPQTVTQAQRKAAAIAQAEALAEQQAQAQAEAHAQAQQAKAQAHAQAQQAKAQAHAQAQQAEAQAHAQAQQAKAQAHAQAQQAQAQAQEAHAQAQAQQAQAQAEAQALAQAKAYQMQQAHQQAKAEARAQATQLQAQARAEAQARSRAHTPPVVPSSQGDTSVQQAAMSGNGFTHHHASNGNGMPAKPFTVPPGMQHQLQMSQQQQQGAAAAHHSKQLTLQHQQHQQMLARQQYMQQQINSAKPKNSFERIMLRLNGLFPNYNKVQLTGFLKEVRTSNNGSLSGLSVDEIIRRVSDLVRHRQRDTQVNASQRMQNKGFANQQGLVVGRPPAPVAAATTPQPKRYQPAPTPAQPAWTVAGHVQQNWHKELVDGEEEEEDPCVICHDEMSGNNILEIDCGHIFHAHCIQEWLKQQNTCPTCRNLTFLKEDYPSLNK